MQLGHLSLQFVTKMSMIKIRENVFFGGRKSKFQSGKILQSCKGSYGMMIMSLKQNALATVFGYGAVALAVFI